MEHVNPATTARPRLRVRRWLNRLILLLAVWLLAAYLILPMAWRYSTKLHPALDDAPRITHTANGIHGDPLNMALVATEEEVQRAMLAAKWLPADPITLKSSLKIATGTILHRSYADAPVSNLYLWGRKQDLAFEQPYGKDPRRRHHVRFWRSEKLDDDGRPLWFGAATGPAHQNLDVTCCFMVTSGESAVDSLGEGLPGRLGLLGGTWHGSCGKTLC